MQGKIQLTGFGLSLSTESIKHEGTARKMGRQRRTNDPQQAFNRNRITYCQEEEFSLRPPCIPNESRLFITLTYIF